VATCATCRTTILFGGVSQDGLRFCNAKCAANGAVVRLAATIPPDVVTREAAAIRSGACPRCKGAGPVDVRRSHRAFSAIFVTWRQSRQLLACRSCGVRAQLLDSAITLIFGWWGFPWGIIYTPIQLGRNIAGMLRGDDMMMTSPELERMVRLQMASQAAATRR